MAGKKAGTTAEKVRKQVEERAYSIWQAEGSPQGRDVAHWLQAESEISTSPASGPARKVAKPAASHSARPKEIRPGGR